MSTWNTPLRRLTASALTSASALLTLLAAAPLCGEASAEARSGDVFHDTIGVEIVNIDVVVTDKKGRPIEGLEQDDFELRIDGQQVPIANFFAVTSAARSPSTTAPPGEAAPPAPDASAATRPLHVVTYLDSFYLTPVSRKRILRDLPVFFEEQTAAGARVMLVTRNQTTDVVVPFTNDADELKEGLAKVDASPSVGIQQITAKRSVLKNVQSIYQLCEESSFLEPCVDCLEQMVEQIRFYSLSLISERRASMAVLGRIVNALSVIEGKKALLHVSDGIQQQAGLDSFFFIGEQLCPERRQDIQQHYLRMDVEDLSDLVAQANASRVTLYALEAAGLCGFSSASAEYDNHAFVPDAQNDMVRIANLQGTLHYLSDETGGKAILNANEFAPDLAELTSELRTYYSLAYQPGHAGAGRTHRVGVKVPKNRSYEVRYRRSFLHKLPEQLLADRALGAVLFDVSENPLEAVAAAGTAAAGAEGRVVLPIEIRIPTARLALIPQDGARRGRLQAIVTAPDETGEKTSIRKKDIDVTLPLEESPGESYRFGVNVSLLPGKHRLGIGLWDAVSTTGSFFTLDVEAPQLALKDN